MAKDKNIYDQRLRDFVPCNRHKGLIGVELELEGAGFVAVPGWNAKAERSLRNGGMEFILPEPKSVPEVEILLFDFIKICDLQGVRLVNSPRASTHIHLNIQQETCRTIGYTVALFVLMEQYLLSTLPGNRSGNLFCMSAKDTGDLPEFMENWVRRCQSPIWNGWHERGKYASLNTNHLGGLGSLEFRLFPDAVTPKGNLDTQKIMGWVRFCVSLLNKGREMENVDDLLTFIDLARTEPKFAAKVFPCELGDLNLISLAAEDAYEVAYAIKRGEKEGQGQWLPKLNLHDDPFDDDDEEEGPR